MWGRVAPLCIFSGEVTCPVILLPSLSGGAERGPGAGGDPDVRGTVEDGRGGGIPPNGGFQSRL